MHIKNCPKCGGEHWGSYECPFTTEEVNRMQEHTVRKYPIIPAGDRLTEFFLVVLLDSRVYTKSRMKDKRKTGEGAMKGWNTRRRNDRLKQEQIETLCRERDHLLAGINIALFLIHSNKTLSEVKEALLYFRNPSPLHPRKEQATIAVQIHSAEPRSGKIE